MSRPRRRRQNQRPAAAAWISSVGTAWNTPPVSTRRAYSRWGLFSGSGRNKSVRIPGRPVDAYTPWYMPVSPGFLRAMRIPLVAGRDLEWRDARPELSTAVIVNESFATRYFPGESALGKRFFRIDGGATLVAQEVVGVAKDAKYTDLSRAGSTNGVRPLLAGERGSDSSAHATGDGSAPGGICAKKFPVRTPRSASPT